MVSETDGLKYWAKESYKRNTLGLEPKWLRKKCKAIVVPFGCVGQLKPLLSLSTVLETKQKIKIRGLYYLAAAPRGPAAFLFLKTISLAIEAQTIRCSIKLSLSSQELSLIHI